jgi:hypothetical protein
MGFRFFGFCVDFTLLYGFKAKKIYEYFGILDDIRGLGLFHF